MADVQTVTAPAGEDWLAVRRQGIGGSDAPAIVGLSSFKTPYQVFLEKRGLAPDERGDQSRREWGRRLEPAIRQKYSDETGRAVRLPTEVLQHPKYSWMLGTIDGFTDDRRLVEIKRVASAEGWGEEGTDEIPEAYMVQVQHYLAVMGFHVADVAALIGISDFRIYEVEADVELQAMLIDVEAEFWGRVQRNDPPDPVSMADVKLRWRTSVAKTVQASDEVAQVVQQLANVKATRKDAEAEEENLAALVCAAMGECDTLLVGDRVAATWKRCKDGKRFDAERFKSEQAALYAKYEVPKDGHRTLLIKK